MRDQGTLGTSCGGDISPSAAPAQFVYCLLLTLLYIIDIAFAFASEKADGNYT